MDTQVTNTTTTADTLLIVACEIGTETTYHNSYEAVFDYLADKLECARGKVMLCERDDRGRTCIRRYRGRKVAAYIWTVAPLNGEHIGDGVYLEHDGQGVWLRALREEGVHQIFLDPALYRALAAYWRRNFGAERKRDDAARSAA